jgi:hypothetical protein
VLSEKLKVSLIDAMGHLAVSRVEWEEKVRILKESNKCSSLKEEIEFILRETEKRCFKEGESR